MDFVVKPCSETIHSCIICSTLHFGFVYQSQMLNPGVNKYTIVHLVSNIICSLPTVVTLHTSVKPSEPSRNSYWHQRGGKSIPLWMPVVPRCAACSCWIINSSPLNTCMEECLSWQPLLGLAGSKHAIAQQMLSHFTLCWTNISQLWKEAWDGRRITATCSLLFTQMAEVTILQPTNVI